MVPVLQYQRNFVSCYRFHSSLTQLGIITPALNAAPSSLRPHLAMRVSMAIIATLLSVGLANGLVILTIGDSHCRWRNSILENARKEAPNVIQFANHLGPKLMYSLGRDMRDYISEFRIDNNSIVVFSAGEIDVRVHFDNYVSDGNYNAHAKKLVFAYEEFLLKNRDALPGVSIWVQGIVPPTDQYISPKYPNAGSKKDRIFYTLLMNHWLRYICDRNGFVFLEMFSEYSDKMGGLKPEYSDGEVHVIIYKSETKELIAQKIREHLAQVQKRTRVIKENATTEPNEL
jgi:hypothetical protein